MNQKRRKLEPCHSQFPSKQGPLKGKARDAAGPELGLGVSGRAWYSNGAHGVSLFDLLERAHAVALEMSLARDSIHRPSREPGLNLQSVPHHALE